MHALSFGPRPQLGGTPRAPAGPRSAAWGLLQQRHRCSSRRPVVAVRASGVRARWCIDVEYGHKQTVTALMQEWVADVGSRAGLTHTNTRLSSGSVGVAESRLELEVTFASLSEWEHFLGAIPAKEHRAWSQRVQSMIVGGSPRWELFRAVPAFPEGQEPHAAAAPAVRAVLALPTTASVQGQGDRGAGSRQYGSSPATSVVGTRGSGSAGGGSPGASVDAGSGSATGGGSGQLTIVDNAADAEVVLDWKGDPMRISPGDKLPFKFL